MLETFDKMLLAGLGALNMTREKAEKLFDDAVRRGQEKQENQPKFVKDVMDSAHKARADLEDIIAKQLQKVVSQMNLATKDDIARVESKVNQLLNG